MAKGRKTGGRKKGTPNKINALLKDEILQAADQAHPDGRIGYLQQQAQENPAAFMTLLGKILPTQSDVTSNGETIQFPSEIVLRAADANGN